MRTQTGRLWDERYSQQENAYGRLPNDFLMECLPIITKGNALSLGEGQGRNAIYLAKNGFSVAAVDSSEVAMQQALKLAKEEQVHIQYTQTNLTNYHIKTAYWQLIISIYCHLPSQVREQVHQNVVNGLATGGYFILESFSPEQIHNQTGGPKNPDMLPSLEILKSELKGLTLISARQIDRDVQEGLHHSGMASVIQILAQKK
jgi:2-polyprenyl-3-methyl-5-hydroxy-6-metoxy-1,4-benzoquinol methylase